MIDRKIGKIKFRRGTDSQRKLISFEEGEVIYSVDKKRIFIGDDVTLGGIPISNKNYVVDTLGIPPIVPAEALEGDIIHEKTTNKTYIVNLNGNVLELLLLIDIEEYNLLKIKTINILTNLQSLTSCLTPVVTSTPPTYKLSWAEEPSDISVNIDDSATFSASAIGSSSITYEWKRKAGSAINTSNVYQKSFTINKTEITDIDSYYCIASNTFDSITSREATLSIGSNFILSEDSIYVLSELSDFIVWEYAVVSPTIIKQPSSVSVKSGTSVSFNIKAIGTNPISYQWRVAGTDISGETNSTYTITNPTVDINSISCKVINVGGDVVSDSANLKII